GHVFIMTGATPSTQWVDGIVALDSNGFIKTGSDLTPEALAAAGWPLSRPPYALETTLPGVFAVGDVRFSTVKRVASAVGEGSIAVTFIHRIREAQANEDGRLRTRSVKRAVPRSAPRRARRAGKDRAANVDADS